VVNALEGVCVPKLLKVRVPVLMGESVPKSL
jgi:hypothetical protein